MALDLDGLRPFDASAPPPQQPPADAKPLDTGGLTPLNLDGLKPMDQHEFGLGDLGGNQDDGGGTISAPPPQQDYIQRSLLSGVYSALGAGARSLHDIVENEPANQVSGYLGGKLNELMGFDTKESDYAPMRLLKEGGDLAQKESSDVLENASPETKARYSNLTYATLDPDKAAWASPTRVVGDLLQSLPSTAIMAASARFGGSAATSAFSEALAAGASREIATKLAAEVAAKVFTRISAFSEGLVGYGQQAEQTTQQVLDLPQDKLDKSPEYQDLLKQGYKPADARQQLADRAGRMAGLVAGALDAVTNLASGPVLGRLVGGEGGNLIARTAKGFATEGLQETVQSAGEQLAGNVAVQRTADPSQNPWDGVLENAIQGGVVGGVSGGAFGVVAGGELHENQPAATVPPPAAAPPAQIAPPAPASPAAPAVTATPLAPQAAGQLVHPSVATPGVRAQAVADVTLTPTEQAGPIPDDLIKRGKTIMAAATGNAAANDILKRNGWPTVGQGVRIVRDGKIDTGMVHDAFSTSVPSLGVSDDGIQIRMPDGRMFEALARELAASNTQIRSAIAAGEAVAPSATPPGQAAAPVQTPAAGVPVAPAAPVQAAPVARAPAEPPAATTVKPAATPEPLDLTGLKPHAQEATPTAKPTQEPPAYDFRKTFPVPIDEQRRAAGRSGFYDESGPSTPEEKQDQLKAFHQDVENEGRNYVEAVAVARKALDTGVDPTTDKAPKTPAQVKALEDRMNGILQTAPRDFEDHVGAYADHFGDRAAQDWQAHLLSKYDENGAMAALLPEPGGPAAPVTVTHEDHLEAARARADTEPTPGQIEAGNYRKAHIDVQGLPITIENPKGSTRSGTDEKTGKPWSVEMPADYGYIKRTEGADGEHMDVYVGPQPTAPKVYIIDQVHHETQAFDEHKAMVGFPSTQAAIDTYKQAFSDGKGAARVGQVTAVTVPEFKDYLKNGNLTVPAEQHFNAVDLGDEPPAKPAPAVTTPAPATAPATFTPKDGWQSNIMKARQYAAAIDVPHTGVKLGDLVTAINAKVAAPAAEAVPAANKPLGHSGYTLSNAPEHDPISLPPQQSGMQSFSFAIVKDGEAIGDVVGRYDPAAKKINIANVAVGAGETAIGTKRDPSGSNVIGQAAVRDLFSQLRAKFPDAETVGGNRVSGARGAVGKPDDAVVSLRGAVTEAPSAATLKPGDQIHMQESEGFANADAGVHTVTAVKGAPDNPQITLQQGLQGGTGRVQTLAAKDLDASLNGPKPSATIVRAGEQPAATGAVVKPSEPATGVETQPSAAPSPDPVAQAVREHLASGKGFASIVQARQVASQVTGEKIEGGTDAAKKTDESVELGSVLAARDVVGRAQAAGHTPAQTFDAVKDLHNRQPTLATRSSTSIAQQAYSTPTPLAYVADHLAGLDQTKTVYEPTAGNGALLLTAKPSNIIANELNAGRAANLRSSLPGATVTTNDATNAVPPPKSVDVVIANPPFGVVRDSENSVRNFRVDQRYSTNEIDHAIALKALTAMKDDGSAVLILGGVNKMAATRDARSDAYNGKAKRQFYLTLYGQYNVTDHFTVDGSLYAKQGAAWPVDVVVIHGRGKSKLRVPAADVPRVYQSWDALKEVLNGANNRGATESAGPADGGDRRPAAGPAAVDVGRGGDGGGGRPGVGVDTSGDGQPRGVRREPVGEQPGGAGLAQPEEGKLPRPADTRGPAKPRSGAGPLDEAPPSQVAYRPASGAASLDTLVPYNMQTATQGSLEALGDRLRATGKTIDSFVSEKLGYKNEKAMGAVLGAEQVDAVALAIDNMDKGAGFILGDQTGVGKGRVVASVIRYAIKNDRVPIFITEKPNLYGDMYRDLTDTGIQEMLGRDIKILMTDAAQSVPLTDDGKVRLTSGPLAKHSALLLKAGAEPGLAGHDVVFTTYNQMQTIKGERTLRMAFLDRIAPGAVVIADESHNAGGDGKLPKPRKVTRSEPGEGAGIKMTGMAETRAQFARKLVNAAHGVLYSSATYAKRPDVMDLYATTDMRLAVADLSKLGEAISKGGVPMQQVVATMLADAGQYIRRERSFEGIKYNTPIVKVDHDVYDRFASILSAVQRFSVDHIKDAAKAIGEELKAEGESLGHDNATGAAGANSVGFSAVMHNLVEQMLLSIKSEAAAQRAIARIAAGEKPVITVSNTMGSFLADYTDGAGIKPGDPININFNSLLNKYLERTRTLTLKKPWSTEPATKHYITDDELGPDGLRAFNLAKSLIAGTDLSSLPVSPLDHIRMRLKEAGHSIAEVTGRDLIIDYKPDGNAVLAMRPDSETNIAGRRKTIAGFNSGAIDAILLNQAGATGVSLHASRTFADKRKRSMVIAQAERNIDTHMQMLGRINRTGQVELPEYDQLVADVPAEKRPAAVLAKKMASLNANTTATRGGAMTAKDVPDFMNDYGDQVAARVMGDMPEMNDRLDSPVKYSDSGVPEVDGAMRKVTGRIPLLPITEQEQLYQILEGEYAALLEQKNAAGENTLEAKTVDLDAHTVSKTQVVGPVPGNASPFAGGVNLEQVDVKRIGKPIPGAEVVNMAAAAVGIDRPSVERGLAPALATVAAAGRKAATAEVARSMVLFNAYSARVAGKLEGQARDNIVTRLTNLKDRWTRLMTALPVGASVKLTMDEGNLYGVVIAVESTGHAMNPLALGSWRVTFALADASRRMTLPMSQLDTGANVAPGALGVEDGSRIMGAPLIDVFDTMQSGSREQRQILTGNLLTAFDHVKGRGSIINYTNNVGDVQQGILMPRDYNYAEAQEVLPVAFRSADHVMQYLRTGKPVGASGVALSLSMRGNELAISVPQSKALGGRFYLDRGVLAAVGRDFFSTAGQMRATVPMDRAGAVVDALMRAGATLQVAEKENLAAARAVVQSTTPTGSASRVGGSYFAQRDDAREKVAGELQRQLKQFGIDDKIALNVVDKMRDQYGSIYGYYMDRVMDVALESGDPSQTMRHETIHALRALGVFKAAEWQTLVKAAHADTALYTEINNRYAGTGVDQGQINEEAVAEMFARWTGGEMNAEGFIKTAFGRVRAFLEAVKATLSKLGYASKSAIFRAIERGEIGQRAPGNPDDAVIHAPPGMASRAQEGTAAFRNWFGASKVVDGEGKPLVVYHGTVEDFDAFSPTEPGKSHAPRGTHYFSSSAENAESYTNEDREWERLLNARDAASQKETDAAIRGDKAAERQAADERRKAQAAFQHYATEVFPKHGGQSGANITPVYLSLQRPMIVDAEGRSFRNVTDGRDIHQVVRQAMNAGHDGLIVQNVVDNGDLFKAKDAKPQTTYVAFDAAQIKSAIGNSGAFNPADKRISFARINPTPHNVTFADKKTEERFASAREGIGHGPGFIQNVRDALTNVAQGFTRHWINLPNAPKYATLQQELRKLEAAPSAAKDEIVRALRGIVDKLNANDMDLFARKVVLDDLSWEVNQEHRLPFGLEHDDVAPELAKVDAALAKRPDLAAAIRQRKLLVREVADRMVAAGVIDAERMKNPAYYRHQVLEYARGIVGNMDPKLKKPRWASRMGSTKDINANYLEAEFEWLHKALVDVQTANTIDWIKNSDHNIRGDVLDAARTSNDTLMKDILDADMQANGAPDAKGVMRSPLNEIARAFRQKIGMGLSDIRQAYQSGQLAGAPARYQAALSGLSNPNVRDDQLFGLLAWIIDNNQPGMRGALTVFKAIAARKQWVKDQLGARYADPQDIDELLRRGFGPDTHVTWQPDEGKLLYTAKTLPEHAIDSFMRKIATATDADVAQIMGLTGNTPLAREYLQKFADENRAAAKDVLAIGGEKYQMVIPKEVAATLNSLRDVAVPNFLAVLEPPLKYWKQWVLINPRRFLKYNLNNMSGDIDAVIAGSPKAIRRMPQAIRELYAVMKGGQPTARYKEAVARGVFDSGLTMQEIPDINFMDEFAHVIDKSDDSVARKFLISPLSKFWRASQKYTTFRENWLRYAAYLDYADRLDAGETMKSVGYGASMPAMVDEITDHKDRAALLARDLVGDYGNVSAHGQDIRRTLIPFYSWMEINAKRYKRLLVNGFSQGIGAGLAKGGLVGATMGVRTTAYLGLRAFAMYALVQMWNNLLHPDEESELDPVDRTQLHLILGKWGGQIHTLRLQGALSDALGWFGFQDAAGVVGEIQKGRAGWGDLLGKIAEAPVNKVVNGLTPMISEPVTLLSGESFYPDAFSPRSVRDNWRELASTFSAENEYDWLARKPSRGYGRSLENALDYSYDPGENAYNRIQDLAHKWLAQTKGIEGTGFSASSTRSRALYDWRRALRYGDDTAARAALATLHELKVDAKSRQESLHHMNPLGAIAMKDRGKFLRTLSPEERTLLEEARGWYRETFIGGAGRVRAESIAAPAAP